MFKDKNTKTKLTKKDLKIAIVGGGNIGKALSTTLVSLGYDVELVCRENHRAIKIGNAYAFEIDGDFGHKSYLVPFVTNIEQLTTKKDIIIFTTKSFDMLNRVGKTLTKLTPKGMVVTIQNAFTIDRLLKLIPDEISVCMICDFASLTVNKITHIRDTNGVTLGVYNKKAINRMKLVGKIFSEFTKVEYTNDIFGFTLGRNIINNAIAILGGISGLRLKDILNDRNGRFLFCKIIEENVKLINKYKIKIIPYNYQLDYYKFVEKTISGWFYRYNIIKLLKKQNGNIKSSALHDLENNEKTEITSQMDRLLNMASKAKLNLKYSGELNNILKEIESGKRNIDSNVFYDKKLVELDKN
ncbi:MAG: ketopantoate reductase family protein [Christensenellales bacterium]